MSIARGPGLWRNWQELGKRDATEGYEFPMFSDAEVVWNADAKLGPIRLFRSLALEHNQPVLGRPGMMSLGIRPGTTSVMFARVDQYVTFEDDLASLSWETTDAGGYHGAGDEEELAALLSLIFGARLRAGPRTRIFSKTADAHGEPLPIDPREMPALPYLSPVRRVHPHACLGQKRLLPGDLELLNAYPALDPSAATALLRAARWYQNALWICDVEPSVAWLMFVSALEVAAVQWVSDDKTGSAILSEAKPAFSTKLKNLSEPAHELVANEFSRLLRSTRRFVDFVIEHLPEPPSSRPPDIAQHPWTAEAFRKTLKKIYEARSNALHEGIPFPQPMCSRPLAVGDPAVLQEMPAGVTAMRGNTWLADDAPIHLHIFEFIARGALKAWWKKLAVNTSSEGLTGNAR